MKLSNSALNAVIFIRVEFCEKQPLKGVANLLKINIMF